MIVVCRCWDWMKKRFAPGAGWSSRPWPRVSTGCTWPGPAIRRRSNDFVQAARYPIHKQAVETVGEGLRGWGSHKHAAWVWGIGEAGISQRADVWPLNPRGEIMLGIKIEDQYALKHTEQSVAVAGLAFAEHGPRDMGLSYGYLEGRADPPVPAEVSAAGDRVLAACKASGLFFLDNVLPDNVKAQIDRGVMIGAGRRQDSAEVGRKYTRPQDAVVTDQKNAHARGVSGCSLRKLDVVCWHGLRGNGNVLHRFNQEHPPLATPSAGQGQAQSAQQQQHRAGWLGNNRNIVKHNARDAGCLNRYYS